MEDELLQLIREACGEEKAAEIWAAFEKRIDERCEMLESANDGWQKQYAQLEREKQVILMRNSALQDVIARLTNNELVSANNTVMAGGTPEPPEPLECVALKVHMVPGRGLILVVKKPKDGSILGPGDEIFVRYKHVTGKFRIRRIEVGGSSKNWGLIVDAHDDNARAIGRHAHDGENELPPPEQVPTCIKCGYVGCSCNGEVFGEDSDG